MQLLIPRDIFPGIYSRNTPNPALFLEIFIYPGIYSRNTPNPALFQEIYLYIQEYILGILPTQRYSTRCV